MNLDEAKVVMNQLHRTVYGISDYYVWFDKDSNVWIIPKLNDAFYSPTFKGALKVANDLLCSWWVGVSGYYTQIKGRPCLSLY